MQGLIPCSSPAGKIETNFQSVDKSRFLQMELIKERGDNFSTSSY